MAARPRLRTTRTTALAAIAAAAPALLAPAAGWAAPLSATRFQVTAELSQERSLVSIPVWVVGAVSPAAPGQQVELQVLLDGAWRTVKRVKLSATSTYRFSLSRDKAGAREVRVRKAAGTRAAAGHSPVKVSRAAMVRRLTTAGRSGTPTDMTPDGTKVVYDAYPQSTGRGWPEPAGAAVVEDLRTGKVVPVATDAQGRPIGHHGSISADGRRVAFVHGGVLVKDLVTGNVVDATTTSSGGDLHEDLCDSPSLSADGTRVAFRCWGADPLYAGASGNRIYLKDVSTGAIRRVGDELPSPPVSDWVCGPPQLSADGSRVVYQRNRQQHSDPDPASDDNVIEERAQVWAEDFASGKRALVSAFPNATQTQRGHMNATEPSVSADGSRVAFHFQGRETAQYKQGIYVKNLRTGALTRAVGKDRISEWPWGSISADGKRLLYMRTYNDTTRLHVVDIASRAERTVSATAQGTWASGWNFAPLLSANASIVAFWSTASDLGPTDTNGADDIYVRRIAW